MAITYVGGTSGSGTGATYDVSLSGTLTGGSDSSPIEGDLIVVWTAFSQNTTSQAPTCSGDTFGAYNTAGAAIHANDTFDIEARMFYAVAGSTPDTTLTIGRRSNAAYGGAAVVQVWRGVDSTTPLDATGTPASGTNSSRANPPSVTPSTSGAIVVYGGAGSQGTSGVTPTDGNGGSNVVAINSDGTTSDVGVYIASDTWTSGAYDPAANTDMTTSTSCAWGAQTIALKPYVPPTQDLTPSLFTTAVATFYAATVSVGAVNLTPSLFTNSNTFYAPTVAVSQDLTPSLVVNTETFYTPTVSAGAVALSPTLVTNTETFYSPTASVGAVNLTPSLYTNTQTLFSPTVSVGAQDLTPSLYSNDATFYTHSVAVGAVALSPSLYSNSNVVYSPSVLVGPVTLSTPLVTNTNQFFTHTVLLQEAQFLEAEIVTNSQVFFGARVAFVIVQEDQQSAPWWEVEKEKKRKKLEEEDVLKNKLLKKQAEVALLLMTPH